MTINYKKWNTPYTAEDKATLLELAGKKPMKEVAEILGRSIPSLAQYAGKHGISLRCKGENHYGATLSNLQVEMIRALDECGFSPNEIHKGAFNDKNYSTVYAVIEGTTWKERKYDFNRIT